jgi:hypothetical protein
MALPWDLMKHAFGVLSFGQMTRQHCTRVKYLGTDIPLVRGGTMD